MLGVHIYSLFTLYTLLYDAAMSIYTGIMHKRLAVSAPSTLVIMYAEVMHGILLHHLPHL